MLLKSITIGGVCLAFAGVPAAAEQDPVCPWDCGAPANKVVDVVDFLGLLAQWGQVGTACDFDGGGVGVTDFLTMLAMWGPCPAPLNDDCEEALQIAAVADGTLETPFDMDGATAGPEPYTCIAGPPTHKDTWYCLNLDADVTKGVRIWSNLELLIEVNAGCACPPGPLVACGVGTTGTEQFLMEPGSQVLIRLVDQDDLPNAELKGSLFIETKPDASEPVNFFEDRIEFETTALQTGMALKGEWAFKPDYLPAFGSATIADPLEIFTHVTHAPGVWWNGSVDLWPPEINSIQFSSNLTPGPSEPLTPRGPNGIFYAKPGVLPELNNNALLANNFLDSFDIVSGAPAGEYHTGMGLDLIALDIDGVPQTVTIRVVVFDQNDLVMGEHTVIAVQGEKPFLGILTKDLLNPIGRVDITDLTGFAEGVSAFSLWGPAPCDDCQDGNVDTCGGDPGCHDCLTPEGICLCVQATPCDEVDPCVDGECPPGYLCCSNSCCAGPVCIPICGSPAAAPTPNATPGALRSDGSAVKDE